MTEPIRNILVPTDFSSQADHALLYAASLGERFGATLHLLHVVTLGSADREDGSGVFPDVSPALDKADAAARERLDAGAAHGGAAQVTVERATVRSVNAHEGIVRYAEDQSVDLLVIAMGSRSGLGRMLMGSVTEKVIRYCPCPILVVEKGDRDFVDPDTGAVRIDKVVVAHDLRENAQLALAYAVDRLQPYRPEIHLAHAVAAEVPAAYQMAGVTELKLNEDLVQKLSGALLEEARSVVPDDWTVVPHVVVGKPNKAINQVAAEQQADLLVVGSETKRTLEERLAGGMSERFVRSAPCPTLIV